ncbi:MAG TPA: polysaccharide biosynthesis tyrosine autokinase, partial [Solirubrobacterales bacterium]|nr:polysaccharide biosynthesis tyrosine autokinase [Solirubrobacterales bacterium]
MDLRELLSILWKWRVLVAIVVVASGLLGALFASQRQATYQSTATIAITPDISSQGIVSADALSALLGTYALTAESDVVRTEAEQILGRPLSGTVNATTQSGTGILEISDSAHSPSDAKDTASAVANAFLRRLQGNPNLSATLVSPASLPTSAVQPRPPLIIGTSLIVGFGVAILLALSLDRFRRRITNADDLVEVSPLPLLGQVERSRRLMRARPQIVWDDPRLTQIQENFRSLRTNIQLTTGSDSIALQITSAGPSQGKSTITANLGVAFADLGVSTAIVDADLRRPAQGQIFELDSKNGSWTTPGGKSSWKTRFTDLAVFRATPSQVDPTEVLQVRFPSLLERLRGTYDLILVDSPPVLPVSDARITAGWMDGVVIVLASGEERPAGLTEAIKRLGMANAKVSGFVINKAGSTGEGS